MSLLPWSRFPDPIDHQDKGWKKARARKLMWVGAAVGVVILGLIGLWQWGYRKIEARSLHRAEAYIAARDFRSAQLTLEQAVQVNPDNQDAKRALAEFYTQLFPAQALPLWEQLFAEDPASDVFALGLSRTALLLKKYDVVRRALEGVSNEGRGKAVYKRHRAALALATKDSPELTRQLGDLAALEPENARMQYNAAAAAAHSSDPAQASSARAKLVELAKGEQMRARATLQLLQLAAASKNYQEEVRLLAAEILSGHTFVRTPGLFELAEYMKEQTSPAPEDAGDLIEWMAGLEWSREAFLWAEELPAGTQKSPPVRRALAECAVRMKDWTRLHEQLQAGAWGRQPEGLLDLAFAARVQQDGAGRARALDTWTDAVNIAAKGKSRAGFDALERLASSWRWGEALETVLWRAHEIIPGETKYYGRLAALAEGRGDSTKLDKIYRDWTDALPDDRYAWASRLYLGVLRGGLDGHARSKAGELIKRADLLPEEAMIWAWAEVGSGSLEPGAALDRIATLTPKIRLRPRAALLHAELSLRAGRVEQAAESWRAAASLPSKLPEERAWLNRLRVRFESVR